jgi:hypothetical protein
MIESLRIEQSFIGTSSTPRLNAIAQTLVLGQGRVKKAMGVTMPNPMEI